jgi:hypothetical protein
MEGFGDIDPGVFITIKRVSSTIWLAIVGPLKPGSFVRVFFCCRQVKYIFRIRNWWNIRSMLTLKCFDKHDAGTVGLCSAKNDRRIQVSVAVQLVVSLFNLWVLYPNLAVKVFFLKEKESVSMCRDSTHIITSTL